MTREEILALSYRDELHYAPACKVTIGPRGGVKEHYETWRVNGQVKTWKRSPERIEVPIKYGFRGPYAYLTETNMGDFHRAGDCTALGEALDKAGMLHKGETT